MQLASCTHVSDVFMMKRDEIINRYASAIRWGEFEKAAQFQSPAHRTRLDEAWLKNIHIATYKTLYVNENPTSNIVELGVEIRYFIEPSGSEKTITDRQIWRFEDDQDKWMLESPLPAFR